MKLKTAARLGRDANLTGGFWLVLLALVAFHWGWAAAGVFVCAGILAWMCGSACTWIAALELAGEE